MKLSPCLSLMFDGRCEEAFQFYERCFDGKNSFLLRYGDSPMAKDVPPEWQSKVCHASLTIADTRFTGADLLPNQYRTPQGFSITIGIEDPADADRLFAALADCGTVLMPLAETFWARRFGVVKDRFGIQWDLNCETPA